MPRAIASVLAQSFADFELLVIEDGSTDRSAALLREIAPTDARIRPLYHEANQGAAASRNTGLEAARGAYIAFLDADDVWHPEKLTTQMAWMQETNSVFSCTSYTRVREGQRRRKRVIVPRGVDREGLLKGNTIACSTVICQRTALGDLRFPPLKLRQDFALWLDLLGQVPRCDGLDVFLTTYHQRTDSLSAKLGQRLRWNWRLYRGHAGLSVMQSLRYMARHLASAAIRRV